MRAFVLALVVLAGCSTAEAAPAEPPEPTLFHHCYSAAGLPYPAALCDAPEAMPWAKKLPIHVYIDPDYPNSDVVRVAATNWNLWLGSAVFVPTDSLELADVLVRYSPAQPLLSWAGVTTWHKFDGRAAVVVTLYGQYSYHSEVVAHELGHVLGLDHDPKLKRSLMYPYTTWERPSLTDADLAALKEHLGLK